MEIKKLAQLEREHILFALEVCKGDRELTSRKLGIGRRTLLRRLKQYGVPLAKAGAKPGKTKSGQKPSKKVYKFDNPNRNPDERDGPKDWS